MQQVLMQLDMRVPTGLDCTAYHEDLRRSFLASYKKDQWFQMSVQGLGTATWRLRGRVMLATKVKVKSVRRRIRDILMKCHERLALPDPANHVFGKHLEAALDVKPDNDPFSGDRHSWTIEPASQLQPAPAASFAAPVATSGQAAAASRPRPPASAGARAAQPAWAYRPCAGGDCAAGGPCSSAGVGAPTPAAATASVVPGPPAARAPAPSSSRART